MIERVYTTPITRIMSAGGVGDIDEEYKKLEIDREGYLKDYAKRHPIKEDYTQAMAQKGIKVKTIWE